MNLCMNYSIAERLLNLNLMTSLKKFLNSNYEELVENASWTLANIVGEGEDALDKYMDNSIFERTFYFMISSNRRSGAFFLLRNVVKFPLSDEYLDTADKIVTFLCNFFPSLSGTGFQDLEEIVYILSYLTENNSSIIDYIKQNSLLKPFFDKIM
jgi:hypothetical protein